MLTRRELAEISQLMTRAHKGIASREDWSNIAALILTSQSPDTVINMAAGGYDMFRRLCKPQFEPHNFTDVDYRRIYARVCVAAARHSQTVVH
jgi:hypothetical protein